jgi:large conductance mechanosensitive channel
MPLFPDNRACIVSAHSAPWRGYQQLLIGRRAMSFVKEFKEFALKGNVVDIAVGIVIGAAFGKIVSSLVSDVLTPPLGYLIGGVDFTGLAVTMPPLLDGQPEVAIRYGQFIQSVFDFVIVAFAIFIAIKVINRMRRKEEQAPTVAPPPPPREQVLLEEIRDLLKQGR